MVTDVTIGAVIGDLFQNRRELFRVSLGAANWCRRASQARTSSRRAV